MQKKDLSLIREINILGPWVHGNFDLGNGIIIKDKDVLQNKRLLAYKKYFIDIISSHYEKSILSEKTICEVGCNCGYFLYEMYKKFLFKTAVGLDPRETNLAKARFIAEKMKLPVKNYQLKRFDILDHSEIIDAYDVVLMPAVLHHLDNPLNALSNLSRMTRDLCIINSLVLPNELNTELVAEKLELKDVVYRNNDAKFGLVGYKLENDDLDGATFHRGIVAVPTLEALIMMMHHVGFDPVKVYKDNEQLKCEVYNEKMYREVNDVIVVGYKQNYGANKVFNPQMQDSQQKKEFETFLPEDIIIPLFEVVTGKQRPAQLTGCVKHIFESQAHFDQERGKKAFCTLEKEIVNQDYLQIIKTFKHALHDKIVYEYAKTCYFTGHSLRAEIVLEELTETINLDWRTVYKAYYLLAVIFFDKRDYESSKKFVDFSLRTFHAFALARELKEKIDRHCAATGILAEEGQ